LKNFPEATPILIYCNEKTNKQKTRSIHRYQFKLQLSWSFTIYKVQGLTVGKILDSFENRFKNGHAYEALSRFKSVKGLFIKNFEQKRIKTSKNI
jgi:hypothetical protein